ncbi:hypothetical protein H2509_20575 [Stappia sp. F7233]|uniref:Uncharacterized protein n=1 Tax=Stappia albiluteola TaxID=2758565 RepID=A0A839AIH9_9HYPH|nr:hypothetical protein [Stappia albiluteola]MBA5779533.1 hypothetical protein [Stappia albiluteola]
MSLPTWPAGVPHQPLRSSWRISRPFNPAVRTEFEAGNDRVRPVGTVQYRQIAQSIRMTDTEFASFDAFVSDDLEKGSKRFRMTVWLGGSFEEKTVQLAGENPFEAQQRNRAVIVSLTLKVQL